jgi:hypothetical protein
MRRITLWLVGTVTVLILLFSYRTSTSGGVPGTGIADRAAANVEAPPGIVTGPAAPSGTGPAGPPTPLPGAAGSDRSPGAGAGITAVVNGTVAQTRWGPVQVQATIVAGRITEITVLQQPNGTFQDKEVNAYALPTLRAEALTAQSAHIASVSGATVTSGGYLESLQAALDAAHFPG